MSLSKNSIRVKNIGDWTYEEKNAGEAGIYPGMLLGTNSSGQFIKHNVTEQKALCQVAIEDALQGKLVSDVYANTYPVRSIILKPGEEFHGLLAGGQAVSIGEKVTSDGAGCFKSASDSGEAENVAVAEAREALDLTAAASPNTLCRFIAL